MSCRTPRAVSTISIHALLTESDVILVQPGDQLVQISIHALLTESDDYIYDNWPMPQSISIHALLTESDQHRRRCRRWHRLISIHALLTESDPQRWRQECFPPISIHALLTESDIYVTDCLRTITDFNPRSPHGERRAEQAADASNRVFQSTLSSRRATRHDLHLFPGYGFQSTLSSRRATAP